MFSELKTVKVNYIKRGFTPDFKYISINKGSYFGNTVGGVPLNMFLFNIIYLILHDLVVAVSSSSAETFLFQAIEIKLEITS